MVQGNFESPQSFINDRASKNEICLHQYHLSWRTNVSVPLTFMVMENLPAPLSFMVMEKFACPLPFINDRTTEIEIFLQHYHLWCRTNLSPPVSFMVQGKLAAPLSSRVRDKFACPISFINDMATEIEIFLHHYHLSCQANLSAHSHLWCRTNLLAQYHL